MRNHQETGKQCHAETECSQRLAQRQIDQHALDEGLCGQFAAQHRADAGKKGYSRDGHHAPILAGIVKPHGGHHHGKRGRGIGLEAGGEQRGQQDRWCVILVSRCQHDQRGQRNPPGMQIDRPQGQPSRHCAEMGPAD